MTYFILSSIFKDSVVLLKKNGKFPVGLFNSDYPPRSELVGLFVMYNTIFENLKIPIVHELFDFAIIFISHCRLMSFHLFWIFAFSTYRFSSLIKIVCKVITPDTSFWSIIFSLFLQICWIFIIDIFLYLCYMSSIFIMFKELLCYNLLSIIFFIII